MKPNIKRYSQANFLVPRRFFLLILEQRKTYIEITLRIYFEIRMFFQFSSRHLLLLSLYF